MAKYLDANKVAKINAYLERLGWWKIAEPQTINVCMGRLPLPATIRIFNHVHSHGGGMIEVRIGNCRLDAKYRIEKWRWQIVSILDLGDSDSDSAIFDRHACIHVLSYIIRQLNDRKVFDLFNLQFSYPGSTGSVEKV